MRWIVLVLLICVGCESKVEQLPAHASLPTIAWAAVDDGTIHDVYEVTVDEGAKTIHAVFEMGQGFSGYSVDRHDYNIWEVICSIRRTSEFDGYTITITGRVKLLDNLGNSHLEDGARARILPGVWEQVNCELTASIAVEPVAEDYWVMAGID